MAESAVMAGTRRGLIMALALGAVFAGRARADDSWKAMNDEVVGGLRVGLPAAAVMKLLGPPARKGKVVEQGADGMFVQEWAWPKKGVTLQLAAESQRGPQKISAITIKAPSLLKTARGIGIGSPAAELIRAYGADRNSEESREDSFVVGTIYGGVLFALRDGKVSEIFVGAAAE